jgi:hypothetical protein
MANLMQLAFTWLLSKYELVMFTLLIMLSLLIIVSKLAKSLLFESQIISKVTNEIMFSYGLCTIHPAIQIGQQLVLKCKKVGQLYHIGVGISLHTQVLSITTNYSST